MTLRHLKKLGICCFSLMLIAHIASPAYATEMAALSDDELSDVTGQALFNLQKIVGANTELTGQSGYTFTRLSIGAKIELNANIDLIDLGNYDIPYADNKQWNATGKGSDIRFEDVSLGCLDDSGCTKPDGTPFPHFVLEDPYIEFAYKGDGSANRQLVGLRVGFGSASGWLNGTIKSLSGDLEGSCNHLLCGGGLASGEIHDHRQDNLSIYFLGLKVLDLNFANLHRLPVGEVSDCALFGGGNCSATKNLYIGFQTEELLYPKIGAGQKQAKAKPGFWINMQDNIILSSNDVLTAAGSLFGGTLKSFDNCRGSAGINGAGVNSCRM